MGQKRSGNKSLHLNALPPNKTWRKSIKAWREKPSIDMVHVATSSNAKVLARNIGDTISPVIRMQPFKNSTDDTCEQHNAKTRRPPVPSFAQTQPQQRLSHELVPWLKLRETPIPPPKPEDNYEISDKGEESDVEEPDRSHKHVPEWSIQYLELITKQASIDSDTIFGTRVPECDLEAIFDDALYAGCKFERPKRRRGSSAEWKRDRLSKSEVTDYKCKMGHTRSWTTNAENTSGNHNNCIV